jgi:hypothetical protein
MNIFLFETQRYNWRALHSYTRYSNPELKINTFFIHQRVQQNLLYKTYYLTFFLSYMNKLKLSLFLNQHHFRNFNIFKAAHFTQKLVFEKMFTTLSYSLAHITFYDEVFALQNHQLRQFWTLF